MFSCRPGKTLFSPEDTTDGVLVDEAVIVDMVDMDKESSSLGKVFGTLSALAVSSKDSITESSCVGDGGG